MKFFCRNDYLIADRVLPRLNYLLFSSSLQHAESPQSTIQQQQNVIRQYNYKKHGFLTLDWRRINLNSKDLKLYVVVFELHDVNPAPCWLIFKDWAFLENLDKMAFSLMGIFGKHPNYNFVFHKNVILNFITCIFYFRL